MDAHLVVFWAYKKTSNHGNDDVDLLAVYKNLHHAYEFTNTRFSYFLSENHGNLTELLFQKPKINLIYSGLRQHFDSHVATKILKQVYSDVDKAISVGDNIDKNLNPLDQWYLLNHNMIKINIKLSNFYTKLMEIQQWISSPEHNFPKYIEIPLIINYDHRATIKRTSSETCRIKFLNDQGNDMQQSFYLGNNLVDLEDCAHREHHFCASFRIYTKIIRD